jgi:hypothetical protein
MPMYRLEIKTFLYIISITLKCYNCRDLPKRNTAPGEQSCGNKEEIFNLSGYISKFTLKKRELINFFLP